MKILVMAMALAWSVAGLAQESAKPAAQDAGQTTAGEAGGDALRATAAEQARGSSPSSSRLAPQASNPSSDRLELDTTVVTGNKELPKVLYIVPWKKAGIGDLPAQPFNTLLDEALMPVDRDVFRREVTYYDALSSHGNAADGALDAAGGSGGKAADGSEK